MPREPERSVPCPCGSGKSYWSCCLRKDRARADGAQAARASWAALDETIEAILPQVRERYTVACKEGCNTCCAMFVRATAGEAEAIADFLVDNGEARARFEARLPSWRSGAGPELVTLDEIVARHRGSPRGGPDVARYSAASLAHQRRRLLCPFNDDDGRCAIYEVRPLPCRVTYVVNTADYCRPDQGRGPDLVRTPELTEAIADARAAIAKAGGGAERSLPEAVADALAARAQRAKAARSDG